MEYFLELYNVSVIYNPLVDKFSKSAYFEKYFSEKYFLKKNTFGITFCAWLINLQMTLINIRLIICDWLRFQKCLEEKLFWLFKTWQNILLLQSNLCDTIWFDTKFDGKKNKKVFEICGLRQTLDICVIINHFIKG